MSDKIDDVLKKVLEPINAHLHGSYESWRKRNPKGMSIEESKRALGSLLKPKYKVVSSVEIKPSVKGGLPEHTFGVNATATVNIWPYIPDNEY